MDVVFPTDNEWGVPALDPDRQPDRVELPMRGWGSFARTMQRPGGVHFYVDDYRFRALLNDPTRLTDLQPTAATEVNLSVFDDTPPAVVLWHTYRKRWLSRFWQDHGLPIYVDLNVPERHQEINLLGVPLGWRAYSTRGYERRLPALEQELRTAKRHAQSDRVLFLVVGGGKQVAAFCREHRLVHLGYQGTKYVHSAELVQAWLRAAEAAAPA